MVNLDVGKVLYKIIYILSFNFLLLAAGGIFVYRSIIHGQVNRALFILVLSLFLINICRVIARYNEDATVGFFYRFLVLTSTGLLISALVVQTIRFIYVFLPTMTAFTLPKILVRVGITTIVLYIYSLVIAFIYYLYATDMLTTIRNGSLDRFLSQSILRSKGRNKWRQAIFASKAFLFIFFWGGLASIVTLILGLVAWLQR